MCFAGFLSTGVTAHGTSPQPGRFVDEGPACPGRERPDRARSGAPRGPDRRRTGCDGRCRGPRGRRRRRGDHLRQRPTGRQPPGQERDRRVRRTSRAAGLVRGPDPGHPRLRADEHPRRRPAQPGRRPPYGDRGHPGPRRPRRPGVRQPEQADRPLPAPRGRRPARPARGDLAGPRRARLAKGRRLAGAAGDPGRRHGPRPRRGRLRGGGQRRGRGARRALGGGLRRGARRRGGHRQGPGRGAARADRPRRRPGHRHGRAERGAPLRHPGGGAARSGRRTPAAGPRRGGPLRRRLDGPKGGGGLPVRRAGRRPCRDQHPGPHPRRRRRGDRHRRRTRRLSPSDSTAHLPKENHMPEPIEVRKVPILNVSDASGLAALVDDGVLDADRVVAVIGKTEGNGGVNDYTRIIADRAFREVLVAKGTRSAEEVRQVPIVWSGGTDGVLSPHATIFATVPADRAERTDEPRLTVGFAMREGLLPEDIGRTAMVSKVAEAVRVAMERAGITDASDVHYVQTKTPLLTVHTIRDAKSRGKTVWTEHTHESMDLSNGCTALGIAVALGEIDMPSDEDVMHDRTLYSSVASCSSGVELDQAQVVVVGNAPGVGGRYRIGHSVMTDALDQDGIWGAIRDAGLELPERPHTADLDGRLVNVFLKCEASQDGQVRGRRNAMLDDSDVHWHRQIKATVGGAPAPAPAPPAAFASVSAAHQGPDGGGPVAAVVDLGPGEPTGYRAPAAE